MAFSIQKTTISLTRGDTLRVKIDLTNDDGSPYVPQEGDSIRFAMKKKITDPQITLQVDVPIDTMMLVINPSDTKSLDFGSYIYDMEITKANGDVYTFITKAQFNITEEVH